MPSLFCLCHILSLFRFKRKKLYTGYGLKQANCPDLEAQAVYAAMVHLVLVTIVFLVDLVLRGICRLCFSPSAKYPGPKVMEIKSASIRVV